MTGQPKQAEASASVVAMAKPAARSPAKPSTLSTAVERIAVGLVNIASRLKAVEGQASEIADLRARLTRLEAKQ